MFTFKHPKPFNQRPVAMQVVARKAQVVPDMQLIVVPAVPDADLTPAAANKDVVGTKE